MSKIDNRDVKYLGVPNICFSLLSDDDKREELYAQQRIERGFDDSETWSLSGTMSAFLLPRLTRFIELDSRNTVRDQETIDHFNNFKKLLELENRDNGIRIFTDDENIMIEKGLDAFKEIFFKMWW